MKIIKEGPNLMVLEDRGLFQYLIGAVFAVAGFFAIIRPDYFSQRPSLWLGFLFVVVGLFVILVSKATTIYLDKSRNKLIFKWKKLIGGESKEYDLNKIREVDLQQKLNESAKSPGYSYRLVFILINGEEVPLAGFSSLRIMGKPVVEGRDIGPRIAKFLQVPFQEIRPPSVSEILSAVQKTVREEMEKHPRHIAS